MIDANTDGITSAEEIENIVNENRIKRWSFFIVFI